MIIIIKLINSHSLSNSGFYNNDTNSLLWFNFSQANNLIFFYESLLGAVWRDYVGGIQ